MPDETYLCEGCDDEKPWNDCQPCRTDEGRMVLCSDCREKRGVEPVYTDGGSDMYVRMDSEPEVHVRDGETTRCGREITDSAATADHYDEALFEACPECLEAGTDD